MSSCTRCAENGHHHMVCVPRKPSGNPQAPLWIVGQNPPVDPARSLNGAWMLHYSDRFPRGPKEELLRRLLTHLQVERSRVYATQIVKCASLRNAAPGRIVTSLCTGEFFLPDELLPALRRPEPPIVLAFGASARDVLRNFAPHCGPLTWSMESIRKEVDHETLMEFPRWNSGSSPLTSTSTYEVEVRGRLVFAPHPSIVGRFVLEKDWLDAIGQAIRTLNPHMVWG